MSQKFLFYRDSGELKRIDLNEIVYAEANKNYVNFLTPNKIILIRITFDTAQEFLTQHHFVKISRTNVISLKYLDRITRDYVSLKFKPTKELGLAMIKAMDKHNSVVLSRVVIVEKPKENIRKFFEDETEGQHIPELKMDFSIGLPMSKSCFDDLMNRITIVGKKTSGSEEDEDIDENMINDGSISGNEINPIL